MPNQDAIDRFQPVTGSPPRQFIEFPKEASACEAAIYWFALAGSIMKDGCRSLREVYDQMPQTRECQLSYTFLRQLPKHLAPLLCKCFNREKYVELYLAPWANSRRIVGLTADGLVALQLAVDYLKVNHPQVTSVI